MGKFSASDYNQSQNLNGADKASPNKIPYLYSKSPKLDSNQLTNLAPIELSKFNKERKEVKELNINDDESLLSSEENEFSKKNNPKIIKSGQAWGFLPSISGSSLTNLLNGDSNLNLIVSSNYCTAIFLPDIEVKLLFDTSSHLEDLYLLEAIPFVQFLNKTDKTRILKLGKKQKAAYKEKLTIEGRYNLKKELLASMSFYF